MKNIGIAIIHICFLGAAFASAAAETKKQTYEFEGTDITAFVEHFRPAVKTLKKPVTVYNWSSSSQSDFWKVPQKPNDENLVAMAQRMGQSFWRNYGSQDSERGGMYGYGLYAALDPVVTRSFGGTQWVLLEMQFPAGFKMIDLYDPIQKTKSSANLNTLSEINKKFKCSMSGYVELDALFTSGGKSVDPSCQRLVKNVFGTIFKIDAFAYT